VYESGAPERMAEAAAWAEPPANAAFIPADVDAEMILVQINSERVKERRDVLAAQYDGMWVPEPGWSGTIRSASRTATGAHLVMTNTTTRLMGGNYDVVIDVPGTEVEFKEYDFVRVTGRIVKMEIISATSMNPLPIFRAVMDSGKVREHRPKQYR
jgi:hypothetical protein